MADTFPKTYTKTGPFPSVQALIPHRPPMLLVDDVLELTPNEALHARRTFAATDPIFAGHFPGHPVLPGVLGIEAMAQAAALLVNLSLNKTAQETLFYFMSIESAKFRQPVLPGQTLDLYVRIVHRRGNVFRFEGEIRVAEKRVGNGTFTAKLQELS